VSIRRSSIAIPFLTLLAGLLFASSASAAGWTQPAYLYRYFVWGAKRPFTSRADDYRLYGYHTIENGPAAFHFAQGDRKSIPDTVEYNEDGVVKRVALDELLRSTGTHAFIVAKDNNLLYENYFNGSARDSLGTSWSLSKAFTSAMVGIAISEGHIKSLDDSIVNYIPELKGQGFDAITIRNLLTMGSGIQYRFGFFPWDEFVMEGYYPNIRQLLLSDIVVVVVKRLAGRLHDLHKRRRERSQPISAGENLETDRHGVSRHLEYRQRAGRF
jgi:CubicO group peptidase (beta-lactamase class C family)